MLKVVDMLDTRNDLQVKGSWYIGYDKWPLS